jgi:DNA invertase Pin-like site-specific DNA recombinase
LLVQTRGIRRVARKPALGGEFDQRRLLFVDRHRSGATTIGREGIAAMLEAARQGRFRILVVRSICRLTRNATDAARNSPPSEWEWALQCASCAAMLK